MTEDSRLSPDFLAVGLTRPATVWNVPMVPFIGGLMLWACLLVFDIFRFSWVGPVLYVVLLALSKWEPRFYDILAAWARTMNRFSFAHWRLWRGISYSPLTAARDAR